MISEMESYRLEVVLAPAPEIRHQMGHCIRVAMSSNPKWYQELCAVHPSSGKGRCSTRVKRANIMRLLQRLLEGKKINSVYEDFLDREINYRISNNPF